jgi:hypothetical protein
MEDVKLDWLLIFTIIYEMENGLASETVFLFV